MISEDESFVRKLRNTADASVSLPWRKNQKMNPYRAKDEMQAPCAMRKRLEVTRVGRCRSRDG